MKKTATLFTALLSLALVQGPQMAAATASPDTDPSHKASLEMPDFSKIFSVCPDPSNLAGSAVSPSEVSITWDSSGTGANSFDVERGSVGYTAGTGTRTSVNGASTNISGLPPNLCQDYYVRSVCGPNDTGSWVGPVTVCPEQSLCDSMDQYTPGQAAPQSSLIYGWYGSDGGAVDFSTAQASSGNQSLYIPNDGTSDVVAWFDTISSGFWKFAFDIYVPTGTDAYYNFQRNYTHGATGQTNIWAFEVDMLANGTASINGGTFGGAGVATYTFNHGQWNTIEHIIDFDNDSVYIQVNGSPTSAGWTYSQNDMTIPIQCNGINFFSNPNLTNPDYYVDNLCISPYTPTCDEPTSLDTGWVTCNEAELTWDEDFNSEIEYGPAGFTFGNGTTIPGGSPQTLTGLTPGTAYEFYAYNLCRGDTSTISGPYSFTTKTGPLDAAFSYSLGQATPNDQPVTFDASASKGADTYFWNFGDGFVATGQNQVHTYTSNGSYIVTMEIEGSCGTDTVVDTLIIDAINLEEHALNRSLSVYPNPAHGFINVEFELGHHIGEVLMRLTDLQGRAIRTTVIEESQGDFNHRFDVEGLAPGSYMLEITNDGKTIHRQISLQ